jgi:hypothetical protein
MEQAQRASNWSWRCQPPLADESSVWFEIKGNPTSPLPRPGGFGRSPPSRGQTYNIRKEHIPSATMSGAEWTMNPEAAG